MNGSELLTRFRATASDDAFAELVRRYANFVFSVARRRLESVALAEEATQTVFTRLAHSAPRLDTDSELLAWLHRTSVHVAIDLWRSETRRRGREEKATMEITDPDSHQLWQEIAPQLDEALNELNDAERKAVLLRFFQGKSMREIGESLGVSEDAAKMRVSRAVEQLRTQLVPRGITTCSAVALGSLIAERCMEAAPANLIPRLLSIPRPAITPGTRVTSSSHLPIGALKIAVPAALVIALALLFRPHASPEVETGTPSVAQDGERSAQPLAASSFARRAAARARVITPVSVKPRMILRVLADDTGEAMPGAQIRAVHFYAGGRGERHELVTDANGMAAIPEAFEGGNRGLNVFVSAPGFVPKAINFGNNAPTEYVLKLGPAVLAAGVVVDEQGQTVSGVRLEARRSEEHQFGQPNTDFQTVNVETDANGRWLYPYIPKSYDVVDFHLTCDGYAVTGTAVPMRKAESTNATLVIKRGFAVAGRVTDSQGAAIPGATVSEHHNYGYRRLSTETDKNGAFLMLGISDPIEPRTEIVVASKGMAPQLRKVELLQPTNVVNFVLAKGSLFRGSVVDESGQPLAGVACRTDSDNQGRRPFQWFAHTDAEGRFEWDSAPGEPTLFWFELDGYSVIRDRLLTPDGSDHEIKLVQKAK